MTLFLYFSKTCSRLFLSVLLLLGVQLVLASDYPKSDDFYERVWLATDRDVYISGDEVRISLATIDGYYQLPVVFSAVVYIELFSADGSPIAQDKALMQDGRGDASIKLPKDLTTDFYYIRAYTNYQKNFGEQSFMTKKIRLVNPFKIIPIDNIAVQKDSIHSNVLNYLFRNDSLIISASSEVFAGKFRIETAFGDASVTDRAVRINDSTLAFPLNGQKTIFDISTSEVRTYIADTATNVSLTVTAIGKKVSFSVETGLNTKSIVSVSAFNSGHGLYADTYYNFSETVEIPSEYKYKCELNGDVIFGKVTVKDAGILPTNILVTSPGNISNMLIEKLNSDGSFALQITTFAENTSLLLTPTDSSSLINITIEPEFFPRFAAIKFKEYVPEPHLGHYIQSLMVNVQLADAFSFPTQPKSADASVFYGRWDESISFNKFISLPSMEDYIRELMPSVYVHKKKRQKSIRISDYDSRGFVGNKPLLLVDGTPFYNHGTVLYIPPKEVLNVYILNRKLSYMSAQFDGILDIRTRDNFAEALEVAANVANIDYISAKSSSADVADTTLFSNTKFWSPVCDNSVSGNFVLDSQKATYVIRIQGLADGRAFNIFSAPIK